VGFGCLREVAFWRATLWGSIAAESLDAAGVAGVSMEPAVDPRVLIEEIVLILAEDAPNDFTAMHAVFSLAGDQEIVDAVANTPGGVVAIPVAVGALQQAWTHRELTISGQGPWLRLLIDVDRGGMLEVRFDYGDTVIPPGHLLPGEAYLTDFERYPRAGAALWLMAYMGNEGHQMRTAAQAATGEASDVSADAWPRQADEEVPPLPELWSRMAALAAICRGADSVLGPRIDAAFCVYRGDHGGCTLARLPNGRAVLSGGAEDSVLLTAAYRGEIDFPELYRGAPRWVHNYYLDERAAAGLLSFCYWWDGRHWYRASVADAPEQWSPVDEIDSAVPDVWSTASTADRVLAVLASIGVDVTGEITSNAADFVHAAEAGVASQRYLDRLLPGGAPEGFDIAEALTQLDSAGTLLYNPAPIDAELAKQLVAQYCRDNNIDTADHPTDRLEAIRVDAGWQVYSPAADGGIATDRVGFLVADDAVIETVPSGNFGEMEFAFAARFAARMRNSLP
jgi:hypothetical protein